LQTPARKARQALPIVFYSSDFDTVEAHFLLYLSLIFYLISISIVKSNGGPCSQISLAQFFIGSRINTELISFGLGRRKPHLLFISLISFISLLYYFTLFNYELLNFMSE